MIIFITTIVVLFFIWVVWGGAVYITELGFCMEDNYPNPKKRDLFCLICGPIAWGTRMIIFISSAFIILHEILIEPFMDWLKSE